jgi:hypothetical protein
MKFFSHRVASLLGILALTAASQAANVEDVIRDTQRTSIEGDTFSLVWWIPKQFWDESLKSNPGVPQAMRAQITSVMGEYNIVALLRASSVAGIMGDIKPRDELVKNTRVEIGGKLIEPLQAEQIAPAAAALLSQVKPMVAASMGQMGQGMEFVVYPGKVDGKPLVDAGQPGALAITFYGRKFQWRLPLGSLLPPKVDRKTGEDFPGNYLYNPFTGDRLDAK